MSTFYLRIFLSRAGCRFPPASHHCDSLATLSNLSIPPVYVSLPVGMQMQIAQTNTMPAELYKAPVFFRELVTVPDTLSSLQWLLNHFNLATFSATCTPFSSSPGPISGFV